MYADEILLLSGSCTGLQRMMNICTRYGMTWDICFNTSESHGGSCSSLTQITIDNVELRKGGKLNYLGSSFISKPATIAFTNFMVILTK